MRRFSFSFLCAFLAQQYTHATILSDVGCSCALTKGTTTTPSASSTLAVGCSAKPDWNGQTTEFCLTDESFGQCGTFQSGFGYVDSCANAGFTRFEIQQPPMIEWDQTPYTFYTGQTINVTWDSINIQPDEWVRIQYTGAGGTRTLTTGSGANITAKSYAVRLSDSTNGLATNVPVTINLPSTAAITLNSNQTISVIQSKLMNIALINNNASVASGATLLCDNGNLTISWRGLGEAQFGVASVTVRSGGGGTTVGTALTNLPVVANMSVNYQLPRSFNPSGFTTYSASISVQEPGGTAYTGTSTSFRLSAAPSVTPTPTPTPSQTPSNTGTPTSSKTPTPSASSTKTPTPSVSTSNTPTPSITPTQTPTPSTTETARPSVDYAAIGRAAASQVDTTTPAIAGALGGIGGVLLLIGGFKWYQNKQMTERRKKKLAMTSRFVQNANSLYGIQTSSGDLEDHGPVQPSIVMYTVANLPAKNSLTKKAAFPPTQGKGSSV